MSTTTTAKAAAGLGNFADERVGASKAVKFLARKIFPDHWSFMLGEVALYSFIILLLSGTFLTFFFVPSVGETTYNGSYAPLTGPRSRRRSRPRSGCRSTSAVGC
jgi:ubiquinol-cytochrome c reductase cytochrome b subunit